MKEKNIFDTSDHLTKKRGGYIMVVFRQVHIDLWEDDFVLDLMEEEK